MAKKVVSDSGVLLKSMSRLETMFQMWNDRLGGIEKRIERIENDLSMLQEEYQKHDRVLVGMDATIKRAPREWVKELSEKIYQEYGRELDPND